jgi:hypothetical protein
MTQVPTPSWISAEAARLLAELGDDTDAVWRQVVDELGEVLDDPTFATCLALAAAGERGPLAAALDELGCWAMLRWPAALEGLGVAGFTDALTLMVTGRIYRAALKAVTN